jgi:hypothetical protein
MTTLTDLELLSELSKIKGGYTYMGAASYQVCFPLKAGGELRFSIIDEDVAEGEAFGIDLYGGELPPMITGFGQPTGERPQPTEWR